MSWHTTPCGEVLTGRKEYGWKLIPKNLSLGEATRDPCSRPNMQADQCKCLVPVIFFIDLFWATGDVLLRHTEHQRYLEVTFLGSHSRQSLVTWKAKILRRDELWGVTYTQSSPTDEAAVETSPEVTPFIVLSPSLSCSPIISQCLLGHLPNK